MKLRSYLQIVVIVLETKWKLLLPASNTA